MQKLNRVLITIGAGGFALGVMIQLIGQWAPPIVQAQPDRPLIPQSNNLLINPDFEDGYYLPDPNLNSVRVPNGWQIRWYTDTAPVPPWGTPDQFQFFQPEVNLIDVNTWPYCCAPNLPPRIHSGRYAIEAGKRFGNQDVSFYQTIGGIPIGSVITASAWLHAWVSSCNPFPTDGSSPPSTALSLQGANDAGCPDNYWAMDSNHMMVGIDPTGGADPRASTVVWNWNESNPAWWGPYDYYSATVPAVAVAQAHSVTMFLRAVTIMPAKFNAAYFDAASLSYSFPISISAQVVGEWPLPVTATMSVQVPVSLTQVTMSVDTGEPIEFIGTTPTTNGYRSEWRFNPLLPGTHRVTLMADELTTPIQHSVHVPVIRSAFQQDRLLPRDPITLTEPIEITFTLYSPVTLTQPGAVLTDPLGSPLSITLLGFEAITPTFNYQWLLTPTLSGTHTLEISATAFMQPLVQSTVAATDRTYLPLVARLFNAP